MALSSAFDGTTGGEVPSLCAKGLMAIWKFFLLLLSRTFAGQKWNFLNDFTVSLRLNWGSPNNQKFRNWIRFYLFNFGVSVFQINFQREKTKNLKLFYIFVEYMSRFDEFMDLWHISSILKPVEFAVIWEGHVPDVKICTPRSVLFVVRTNCCVFFNLDWHISHWTVSVSEDTRVFLRTLRRMSFSEKILKICGIGFEQKGQPSSDSYFFLPSENTQGMRSSSLTLFGMSWCWGWRIKTRGPNNLKNSITFSNFKYKDLVVYAWPPRNFNDLSPKFKHPTSC